MPYRLPPLPALRFFEAAGRLRSFKAAAAELNVTPSAVSHAILGLEETLGVELFVREPRGLSLTAAGADYLTYVSEAMTLLAVGTRQLPGRQGQHAVTVSCAPTFAARWLLPRLPGFLQQWPEITLSLDTSRRAVDFPLDRFDFALRMSRTPAAGPAWTRLLGERLVPVASPACRDQLLDRAGAVDLSAATLIHVTPASEDWQTWCDAHSGPPLDLRRGLRLDTVELAFEAAALGLGVAIGRRPLVDRDLAAGRLVELAPAAIWAETAYWLVGAAAVERRPELRAFRDWLVAEAAGADQAMVDG